MTGVRFVVALICLAGDRLAAQDVATMSCEGRRVDSIVVERSVPTVAGVARVPVVGPIARDIHVTTNEVVIRDFLLLQSGDICTELRRAESERILRAQSFLADANIAVRPSALGGVVLTVRTTDEASLVLAGTLSAVMPMVRAATLGNSNIDGTTMYLAGTWRDGGQGYRDEFGGRFQHQQLFGRPYVMDLEAERHSLGDRWVAETSHPFYTDLQRIAWRLRVGSNSDYIPFPTDSQLDRALRVDRRFFDVGAMVRIGPPGRLTLFGASLSGDDDRPGTDPVVIGPAGLVPDADSALRNRFTTHRIVRGNILWGVRDLSYKEVAGYDALTGTQDIPQGFQLGTMFGRSLSVLGSQDDDIFLATDLYVGVTGEYSVSRLQLQVEGRRSNPSGSWDGILTSGRAAQYVKATDRNILVGSFEWSGGWKQRLPFNLTFDDPIGGVRGFANSRLIGGQRFVGRAESRWVVGPVSSQGDLGVALFADAGRLLPGDVPFGSRSPLATSLGFSILAAAPRHSARLWRMDIAVPVHGSDGHRIEIKFTGADNTKFFFREPSDVERTRELTVPSSVFKWP